MDIRLISIAFLLATCQYLPTKGQICKTNSEEFNSFYNRFTTDSAFQISRVIFPLEGATYFVNYRDELDSIPWNKDKWKFCIANIYKLDSIKYKMNILIQGSDVKENIWIKGSGFEMERRFKLINGKWYLVYYIVSSM
jgi:hypothetical protein